MGNHLLTKAGYHKDIKKTSGYCVKLEYQGILDSVVWMLHSLANPSQLVLIPAQ